MIRSRQELMNHLNHGHPVKYVFFWGHQKPKSGVSKTCFSQWYEASFKLKEQLYLTAEHYMMAMKAELFNDFESRSKILAVKTPSEAKKWGRKVVGFDEFTSIKNRFEIVVSANRGKFGQHAALKEFLIGTGDRVLVEASPVDKIWGIGWAATDPAARDPSRWQGLNLLGFSLMQVRDEWRG